MYYQSKATEKAGGMKTGLDLEEVRMPRFYILPWVSLLYFYFVTMFLQVPTKSSKEKQKHSNLNLKLEQQPVWGS